MKAALRKKRIIRHAGLHIHHSKLLALSWRQRLPIIIVLPRSQDCTIIHPVQSLLQCYRPKPAPWNGLSSQVNSFLTSLQIHRVSTCFTNIFNLPPFHFESHFNIIRLSTHSTHCVVAIVAGLRAGRLRNYSSISGTDKRFFSSPKHPERFWADPPFYF
jgi:hypothetical protein